MTTGSALVVEVPATHGAGLAGTGHQGVDGADVAHVLCEAWRRKRVKSRGQSQYCGAEAEIESSTRRNGENVPYGE